MGEWQRSGLECLSGVLLVYLAEYITVGCAGCRVVISRDSNMVVHFNYFIHSYCNMNALK